MTEPGGWLRNRRPLRVALIAATFPLPFTNLLSGAFVTIATLTGGWRSAALDAAIALAVLVAGLALVGGPWNSVVPGALLLWSGAIFGGHLLGRYRSLSLALQGVTALALAGVLVLGMLTGDPAERWLPLLEELLAGARPSGTPAVTAEWLPGLARLMNGVIAGSLVASIVLAWLVGAWLGGRALGTSYREAFLALRLGRVLAIAAVLIAVAGLALFPAPAANLLLVAGVAFVIQGLSVVHWLADRRQWHRLWPVALYGALLFVAPFTVLMLGTLGTIGYLDNWYGLRRAPRDVV